MKTENQELSSPRLKSLKGELKKIESAEQYLEKEREKLL